MSFLLLAIVGLVTGTGAPPATVAPCAVQGSWTLESVTVDGKPQPMGKSHHLKLVTATHYAWVSQQPGPLGLNTVADSLAAFRTGSFGGGTYRVSDSTYTERLEYFYDPARVGREMTATCRVNGNRWQHTFQWPIVENGRETRRARVEEVWRKNQ